MLFRRHSRLSDEARVALARVLGAPTFEACAPEELDGPGRLPAARCASVRDGFTSQGHRSDRRPVRAAPGGRLPGGAAPLGTDDSRRAPPARPHRLARRCRRRPGVCRRWRCEGPGRVPGWPVAAASDGGDRSPAHGDRDPLLPARAPGAAQYAPAGQPARRTSSLTPATPVSEHCAACHAWSAGRDTRRPSRPHPPWLSRYRKPRG